MATSPATDAGYPSSPSASSSSPSMVLQAPELPPSVHHASHTMAAPAANASTPSFNSTESICDAKKGKYVAAESDETGIALNDSRNAYLNKSLLLCAMVAALSSINYGWVIGSVNIPALVIEECSGGPETWTNGFPSCIPMSSTLWGLVVGLTALGAWAGSMYSGKIADWLGRKRTLMYNNAFFVVGALLCGTATSIAQLSVGRFVAGIGCGFAANIVSTYNSEAATTKSRGFLGGFQQLMILVGLFLSQVVSIGLSNAPLWRVLFSLSGALAIIQSGLLFMIPESPKYLATKKRYDESRRALQKLRGNLDVSLEFEELVAMLDAGSRNASASKPSLWQILSGKTEVDLRHLVFCALFLMLSQQWSGAKGVMFYSTEILSATFHLTDSEIKNIPSIAQLLTLGIGAIGAVAVVIGMSVLDKIGRRTVLIFSSLATSICAALIVVGSKLDLGPMVAVFMYAFNLVFQCGVGFIPYLSSSELVPYHVLGSISGLATSVNCLTLFIISFIFPILDKALGPYLFVPFVVTNFITFLFGVFMMPEARGKVITEVIEQYQGPPRIVYEGVFTKKRVDSSI